MYNYEVRAGRLFNSGCTYTGYVVRGEYLTRVAAISNSEKQLKPCTEAPDPEDDAMAELILVWLKLYTQALDPKISGSWSPQSEKPSSILVPAPSILHDEDAVSTSMPA